MLQLDVLMFDIFISDQVRRLVPIATDCQQSFATHFFQVFFIESRIGQTRA